MDFKKKLISKLYHTNLQLIDKLYNELDDEWNEFLEKDDNKVYDNVYNKMTQVNSELNDLLDYFDDSKKEEDIQSIINWNKTMSELLPVIWFVYLYKFNSN